MTACKLLIVRNVLDKVNEVSQLFVNGSKKITLLQEVVQQNPNYSRQHKVIFNVCITRWVENLHGYNQVLLAYLYIVEALVAISHKLDFEKYPNWRQWDTGRYCSIWFMHCLDKSLSEYCFSCVVLVSLDLLDLLGQVEVDCWDLAFIQNDGAKEYFSRCF